MATAKRTRPAPKPGGRPALVTPEAPAGTELEQLVPAYAQEEPVEEARPDPGAEPLAKEYVVLGGLASFGPVRIGGRMVTAKKNKLYYVPDLAERTDILATGRFRAAVKADLARATSPSAGPGGAITRDLLPEGAVKGGLIKP